MKKKILFASMIVFAGILVSCKPSEPEILPDVTPENVLEYLLRFAPYESNQKIEFVHESTGREWLMTPIESSSGKFPNASCRRTIEIPAYWSAHVEARYIGEEEDALKDYRNSTIFMADGDDDIDTVRFFLSGAIRLSHEEYYEGAYLQVYSYDEFFSSLGDTIRFPLTKTREGKTLVEVPEGRYITTVKDKGITDFCVDGKTIWKRKQ